MAATTAVGSGLIAQSLFGHFRNCLLLVVLTPLVSQATNFAVIVAGLGGLPEYETEFVRLGHELETDMRAGGVETVALSGAGATSKAMTSAIAKVAERATPADTFSLYLIGHGTFDGDTYKFNLPGPDITGPELQRALNAVHTGHQLIVDGSSCSGAVFGLLKANGRIVITATKSGNEKNPPVFTKYWVEALRDPAADSDKNGVVSALEAYNFATRRAKAYFENAKLLATEHALITSEGSRPVAAAALLAVIPRAGNVAGPASKRAQELEARVERLKQNKSGMRPDVYKQELLALLVELAKADMEGNP